MREIHVNQVTRAVRDLVISANLNLNKDIACALKCSREKETYAPAQELLEILEKNAVIARETAMPICQDTGMAVIFMEIGQEVHFTGGSLEDAVNTGVSQGYTEGLLRKSVVRDPLDRVNTGDNTPAVLHVKLVPGDRVKITAAPKGFGSENMSRLKMLSPADGVQGVMDFVVETVKLAGPNPCPPMVIGVGIGGTFEKAAQMAKEALLIPLDKPNPNPYYEQLECRLLELVNKTGIGPQGFGGKTTALGLHILTYPTHIAGLPVAVNISCHVTRHGETVL
ncbi:MAG: fumarate hydratase [Clostridia bacterium]|nr:fumarate hydratase [Clostridia bacterium]